MSRFLRELDRVTLLVFDPSCDNSTLFINPHIGKTITFHHHNFESIILIVKTLRQFEQSKLKNMLFFSGNTTR